MLQLRRLAAQASGVRGRGGCQTTTLALTYGARQDPQAINAYGTILQFFELFVDSGQYPEGARQTWHLLLVPMADPARRTAAMCGPVAATIAVLQDAGWRPTAADD